MFLRYYFEKYQVKIDTLIMKIVFEDIFLLQLYHRFKKVIQRQWGDIIPPIAYNALKSGIYGRKSSLFMISSAKDFFVSA